MARGLQEPAIELELARGLGGYDVGHLHGLRDKIGYEMPDAVEMTAGLYACRRRDGIGVVLAGW